jgi:hypothetical protein
VRQKPREGEATVLSQPRAISRPCRRSWFCCGAITAPGAARERDATGFWIAERSGFGRREGFKP